MTRLTAPDGVALWQIDAASAPALLAQHALLSAAERARAARFKSAVQRERFMAGRVALRLILAWHSGEAAAQLAFDEGPHGKPRLTGPLSDKLSFNLSHAAALTVVAVGGGAPLGVDVEFCDPTVDWRGLARKVNTSEEIDWLLGLPEADARRAFFQLWSRKEAYVKAIGAGFSLPLVHCAVSCADAPPRLLHVRGSTEECKRWQMHDLAVSDYAGALVTRPNTRVARWLPFARVAAA